MSMPDALLGPRDGALRAQVERLGARVRGRLKLGLATKFTRYGLSRDLSKPITHPSAKIAIDVRPLRDSDLDSLFSSSATHDPAERLQLAWRKAFVDKGAQRGYVAVDRASGKPCYIQWLFGAADNDFIHKVGGFPMLKPNEALLENAYTPAEFRGLGIMSAAMALIAECAHDIGAVRVLTFVDCDNIASLKGCARSGFQPDQLHHRTRYAFGLVSTDRFEPLPLDDPRRTLKF